VGFPTPFFFDNLIREMALMITKAMAIVTAIKSLYEVGTNIIERGKEFFLGKSERRVPELIDYIPAYEKIQMDTTFKGYTKDEIVSDCMERIREELFSKMSVDILYNLIVITIAKTVRKLLTKTPMQIKGEKDGNCKVIFKGTNKTYKNREFPCRV
jgi:hypothetical protein